MSRLQYLLALILLTIVDGAATLILEFLARVFGGVAPTLAYPLWKLMLAIPLLLLWPSWVIQAKRMHDFNCSALWVLPLLIVSLAHHGNRLLFAKNLPPTFTIWFFPLAVATAIGFVFLRGTKGPNHFGPDPIGI